MSKKQKNIKGITLVALVITIIILLILAGVTIVTLTENVLFEKTKQSKIEYEKAQIKEELKLAIFSIQSSDIDNFSINRIIEKLPQEKNLDLDKLEWDVTQQEQEPAGIYKGYNFYINDNYEVILGDKVTESDSEQENEISKITRLYYKGNDYSDITGGWDFYVNGELQANTIENGNYTATYGKYNITEEIWKFL